MRTIALAYSGGLDTSIIVPWLKEQYAGARVVCVAADIGQGDELEGVRRRGDRSTAASDAAQALRDAFRAALREILSDWEHAVEVSRGELAPLDLEILHSARAQARPRRRREEREPAVTEAAVEGAPVEGAPVEGAPVEGVSEDAPAASMEDAAGEAPEDGAAA